MQGLLRRLELGEAEIGRADLQGRTLETCLLDSKHPGPLENLALAACDQARCPASLSVPEEVDARAEFPEIGKLTDHEGSMEWAYGLSREPPVRQS